MAIDSALGRLGIKQGVCTSSTRPTNPFEGQVIYESDTNRTLVYDNAAWVVVADNQVLSIDAANSRVGIGTTTPTVALQVDSGSTDQFAAPQIYVAPSGHASSDRAAIQLDDIQLLTDIAGDGTEDFSIYSNNAAAHRLSIDGSGNVGIGTYSPNVPLTVEHNNTYGMSLASTGTYSFLTLSDATSTGYNYVGFGALGDDLRISAGGSQRMAIASSGNVGIGTTSPAETLDVVGGNIRVVNTVAGGEGAHLRLENQSSTTNATAGIYFGVDSGSASPTDTGNAEILCINSGSSNKGILQFRVYDGADSEAIKIAGNGSDYGAAGGGGSTLRNGVAFANAGFAIDKGWASYPGIHVFHTTHYGDTNQSEFRVHGWNTSYASYPARTGSDFSVNFRIDGSTYSSSDRRHKTNIVDNPHGLSTILQLQPRKFDRINSEGLIEENNTNILGFVAQEVIEVLPEAVNYYPDEDTPNENGWCRAYSLSESYIVSTLVNAVKELSAQNDALAARIEALEAGS